MEVESIKNRRVLVIGIDGGTFSLFDPWLQAGLLPNLNTLVKTGTIGTLRSIMPPFSASAWTSFMTGMNPGKHGVFDFRGPLGGDGKRPINNASSIRAESLWKILSEGNKKVGILNVPMTYPPEEVNGFIVGGMLTPTESRLSSYPQNLMADLIKNIGSYQIELDWDKFREESQSGKQQQATLKLISDAQKMAISRGKAAKYLMEDMNWDFFIVVITGTDRLQHFIWKYVDKSHKLYDPTEAKIYEESIVRYYQEIDRIIGELVTLAGTNVTVIVMSDHGFGPQYKKFCINKWLLDSGLLAFTEGKAKRREWLKKFDIAGFRKLVPERIARKLRSDFNVFSCIDWSNTKAYSGTSSEQGIFINLKGRNPAGVVDPDREYEHLLELIGNRLLEIRDPDDGLKIVDQTYRKEQIYNGPYINHAPDLIMVLRDMSYLVNENLNARNLLQPSLVESGSHRMDGIFIVHGPGINEGKTISNPSIMDIAPTILHLLEVPIPDSMDGKVLRAIFKPESELNRSPLYVEDVGTMSEDKKAKVSFTDEEERELEKRLKGLGYID